MKYTVNIESGYGTKNFRLNNIEEWAICENPSILSATDFQTTNQNDIISRQKRDITVNINNEEFEIESEMGLEFGNEKQLSYAVYGFRKEYPSPPDENQLLNLLLNGNDNIRNILVLKTDGRFYLLQQNQILDYVVNPEYVLQYEGFQPHNGYVGPTINDNRIRNYVQNIYKAGIYHWHKHLLDKELHDHVEIELSPESQIPEIIDLFSDLEKVKNNWKPDF